MTALPAPASRARALATSIRNPASSREFHMLLAKCSRIVFSPHEIFGLDRKDELSTTRSAATREVS